MAPSLITDHDDTMKIEHSKGSSQWLSTAF